MPSRVDIHHANIQTVLTQRAVRWGDRAGRQVANAAKQHCPVDEGRLRGSITHTVTVTGNTVTVRVGSPLAYARYVHEGTGLYGPRRSRIYPVSAKALKFRWDGHLPLPASGVRRAKTKRPFVFFSSVRGQKPQPFLADALEDVFGPLARRNTTTTT